MMKINWIGNLPVSASGAGCVIGTPSRGGFGFRRLRAAGKGIAVKIGVTLGAVALAGTATLGMIELGYEEHTAAAVTAAAGKVGAATVTALLLADRRKKRKAKSCAAESSAVEPERRVPPSTTAPADEQPGRAN
ncbi:hypothetical protein [Streptomyces sp. 3211]|uniref:hypothetical protein n=1 Tax=Streptomyces sp. 3211 TaxID=1964449 RepID=UPI0009A4ED06|nr:hypothetical protein [Streptomyces sp. 3211]